MIFHVAIKTLCDFRYIAGDRGFHDGDNAFGIKLIAQIAKDILKKKVLHFCGMCHQRNPIQKHIGRTGNFGKTARELTETWIHSKPQLTVFLDDSRQVSWIYNHKNTT